MLFISHRATDKQAALDVMRRALECGYAEGQLFLDSDPESGIPAGSDWEYVIYQRLKDCRALIVVCSPRLSESKWCFVERVVAKTLGKLVFPVVIEECETDAILGERQAVFPCREGDAAFDRLWKALEQHGHGPYDARVWPPLDEQGKPTDPCPYPGLMAFSERFAPVYFGRDRETLEVLETLNRMRNVGEPRLLIIHGGSGSGKSSLLRAGVLPRLDRNSDWQVLATRRYGQTPNDDLSLLAMLAQELASRFPPDASARPDWKELRARFESDDVEQAAQDFFEITQDLNLALDCRDATTLLPIDQFEELLTAAARPSAERFVSFLQALLSKNNGRLLVIGTLRSDYLDIYERHPHTLRPPHLQTYRLPPFPWERVADVIVQPAARVGVTFTNELIERLKLDAPTSDALPLLAFTVEKLFRKCATDKQIELTEYEALGGMNGAVEQAVKKIVPPHLHPEIEQALRLSFVRHLVQVNEKDEFVRRPACWSDLPAAARPLLKEFVNERLLHTAGEGAATTVEVSHEALFRCWRALDEWLKISARVLRWRRDVERDRKSAGKSWHGLTRSQLAIAGEWPKRRAEELTVPEIGWIKSAQRKLTMRWMSLVSSALMFAAVAFYALYALQQMRYSERKRGEALVEKLLNADAAAFHGLLESDRSAMDRILATLSRTVAKNEEQAVRIRLVQFSRDPDIHLEILTDEMVNADKPDKFFMLRDSLRPEKSQVAEELWRIVENGETPKRRFRAACALAEFSPLDHRWESISGTVVELLVHEVRLSLEGWLGALAQVRTHLLPPLKRVFRDESQPLSARIVAADAISRLAGDDAPLLCQMLAEATPDQYKPLFDALGDTGAPEYVAEVAVKTFRPILDSGAGDDLNEASRVLLGRRKAGAAITLLKLNRLREAMKVFRVTNDPEAITQFIHGFSLRDDDPSPIITLLGEASDARERYGLLLTLGTFEQLTIEQRNDIIELVNNWYTEGAVPPSMVHSAALWLLQEFRTTRHWNVPEQMPDRAAMMPRKYEKGTDWFVEQVEGLETPLTFVVFEPGDFPKGPLLTESDRRRSEGVQKTVTLRHRFAMCNREISIADFRKFVNSELPEISIDDIKLAHDTFDEQHPVVYVVWYEAILFCNWLTDNTINDEKERCYLDPREDKWKVLYGTDTVKSNGTNGEVRHEYARDLLAKAENWKLRGYRLPSEDEWECACRAGEVVTRFSFGSDIELLAQYGVANSRSAAPCMSLRPNLRGLFDIHGNAREWCQDWNDRKYELLALRGGGWEAPERQCRAARRSSDLPVDRDAGNGFRIVRSIVE